MYAHKFWKIRSLIAKTFLLQLSFLKLQIITQPIKFKVLKVLKLNFRLIFNLISVSCSYFVVLMQFEMGVWIFLCRVGKYMFFRKFELSQLSGYSTLLEFNFFYSEIFLLLSTNQLHDCHVLNMLTLNTSKFELFYIFIVFCCIMTVCHHLPSFQQSFKPHSIQQSRHIN